MNVTSLNLGRTFVSLPAALLEPYDLSDCSLLELQAKSYCKQQSAAVTNEFW